MDFLRAHLDTLRTLAIVAVGIVAAAVLLTLLYRLINRLFPRFWLVLGQALARLQFIDRRIMYLLLAVVVALPIVWDVLRLPIRTEDVQAAYDAVQNVKPPKIVLISVMWSAGTKAENEPQTEMIVRHLFRKGIRVAVLPWDPQGVTLAENLMERVSDDMGKEYGRDWVLFPFQTGGLGQIISALGKDIRGLIKKDKYGTPLTDFDELPMMRDLENARQLGMVVETTGSGTIYDWISFMGQPYQVPLVYCPTSVLIAEAYDILDSRQIAGMLPGLVGAAEYEKMLGRRPGFAHRGANSLSTSHILIILLIILGNVGYLVSRRQQGR